MPRPPAAWPAQANDPANAAATITNAALSQFDLARRSASEGSNKPASRQVSTQRTSQSLPNVVSDTTVHHTPCEKTSATGCPLIAAAVRSNHAAPEMTASARLIRAIQVSRDRTTTATRLSSLAVRNAGSAMKTTKNATPATSKVAAK